MTATRLAGPSATKASLRSSVIAIPTGWIASFGTPATAKVMRLTTVCFAASMTLTVPPISAETQNCAPSAVHTARAAVDEDVGDNLARRRVDDVRHAGRLGGVDEVSPIRAYPHTLGFDTHR